MSVRDLAEEISRLPHPVPVVLVMAQCFSGAFADVIFCGGDPKGALGERSVVGFFSAQKDREAAGCSYATETGQTTRISRPISSVPCAGRIVWVATWTGADYDGDGTVSLHEAFCYALIHDPSADSPGLHLGHFLAE